MGDGDGRSGGRPHADAWLAAGLAQLAAGSYLLSLGDPFLLTMWGVALVLFGLVFTILSTGFFLHLWE